MTALLNFGALGVVVTLIVLGLLVPRYVVTRLERENTELKEALATERRIGDQALRSGEVTTRLIDALTGVVERPRPLTTGGDPP